MEMSQFTDYSLRALIYSGLEPERLVSVRSISEAFNISQNHLVKVVHKLSQLGYLDTFKGRGGGFRLAMEPADINIGELVRKTERFAIVECLSPGGGSCCITGFCQLKGALAKAQQAFLGVLDGYTLSDFLKPKSSLREALSLVS
jgi:Rrf2 family nitric oxide-sensitive transcriptional repressor